jgi:hypothetical protein
MQECLEKSVKAIKIRVNLHQTSQQKLRDKRGVYLKVRLILSPVTCFCCGIWCSQLCCMAPFMMSNEPALRLIRINLVLSVLCLISKRRVTPRLNEAITGFTPNSLSLSLCQPTLSVPLWYLFSSTLLN